MLNLIITLISVVAIVMIPIWFIAFILIPLVKTIIYPIYPIYLNFRRRHKFRNYIQKAEQIKINLKSNPWDQNSLSGASEMSRRVLQDFNNIQGQEVVRKLSEEIQKNERFLELFEAGREKLRQRYYQEAIESFSMAQVLYSPTRIESEISHCQKHIHKEEPYTYALNLAHQSAQKGQFKQARDIVKKALAEFRRIDGENFLAKLEQVIQGKKYFAFGVLAERADNFQQAITHYQTAVNLIPELIEARIQLGIVAIKQQNWQLALDSLKEVKNEQAAYLRGFAYLQQKQWQKADKEWKLVSIPKVQEQREKIKLLAQADKVFSLQIIQEFVTQENLEEAKSSSQEFIEKFGANPIVEQNLDKHIRPRLEAQIWAMQDWEKIAQVTEKNWLEEQNIQPLHNWAIATYYQAQKNPNKLSNLIIAWSTALANLENNPSLQDIPWLGSRSIVLKDVSERLNKILETLIEQVKDNNLEQYLHLWDLYRQEKFALDKMGNPPSCGVRVKELFISPGCYKYYRNQLPNITFPAEPWRTLYTDWETLYTDWGKAVAACLEGNIPRAIQIKPNLSQSPVEQFAQAMVSYYEGCYYLREEQERWREAISPLKQAQKEIRAKSDWTQEVERLCQLQARKLTNLDDHLYLAQFWFELLDSQPARSYLAEWKTRKVAEKLSNQEINDEQALFSLQEIKKLDANNPLVLDMIERINMIVEEEQISECFQNNNFQAGMAIARLSRHYSTRYRVAQYLINILIDPRNSRYLSQQRKYQMGLWAYELCPDEPAFQSVYQSLGIHVSYRRGN